MLNCLQLLHRGYVCALRSSLSFLCVFPPSSTNRLPVSRRRALQGHRYRGGQEGQSPPPIFAGIEAKTSSLKNIGLLLPPRFSDLPTALALVLRSSSLSQIATEEWRGEYISPRVQWHDEEWGILLPTNRIFSVVKLLKDEGKSAMQSYFKMLMIQLKSRKQNIWLPTFLIGDNSCIIKIGMILWYIHTKFSDYNHFFTMIHCNVFRGNFLPNL